MTLYRADGPWRLADAVQQVYPDTWCPDWCSYTYFVPGQSGVAQGLPRPARLQRLRTGRPGHAW